MPVSAHSHRVTISMGYSGVSRKSPNATPQGNTESKTGEVNFYTTPDRCSAIEIRNGLPWVFAKAAIQIGIRVASKVL